MKEKSLRNAVLEKRYFIKDKDGNVKEDWNHLCLRVSNDIAFTNQEQKDFYNVMKNCDFLPNSPVLMNAGINEKFTYSACFVLPLEDSMNSIMDAVKQSALISKMGGGCGYNFSTLRPKNFKVGSTGGVASGALSFMEIFNTTCEVIKQGGKRRGAQMAILHVWHPDIEEFIDAKLRDGRYSNFNFSVGITDAFMKAVKEDSDWDLIWNDEITKTVKAKYLWDKIINNAHKNGEPGVIFLDTINENYVLKDVCSELLCVNPCLTGDSLLLDRDFLKPIDNGNGDNYTAWKTGNKETIELKLNNGMSLKCTPDHQIMLEDGNFIEAKDTLGKSIKWGLGDRESNKPTTNLGNLKGFIFGNGFFDKNYSEDDIFVKLNPKKEKEISDLLKTFNYKESDIKELKDTKLYHSTSCGCQYKENYDFLKYRVWNRDLPDEILYGDSLTVKSFLKGLFEANGSCNINSQISLKGTCKSMIEKVQILLASFGIPSWVSTNKPRVTDWKNGIYTSKESYNLQIAPRNAFKFKEKIGFYSYLKNDRIKKLSGAYKTKLRVIEIIDNGYEDVYDFNMNQGNHYNFCNGVVVHNCGKVTLHS